VEQHGDVAPAGVFVAGEKTVVIPAYVATLRRADGE
jgi:hypothetical protein